MGPKTREKLKQTILPFTIEDRGFDTPCHIWGKSLKGGGYGQVTINYENLSAHRVAYEQRFGPIPDELQIDHKCRVRNCINPEHLEPVTQSVNVRRGRTCDKTRPIAERIKKANGAPRAIAKSFGVSAKTVMRIQRGERW